MLSKNVQISVSFSYTGIYVKRLKTREFASSKLFFQKNAITKTVNLFNSPF